MDKERRNSDEQVLVSPPEGSGGRKKTIRMMKFVLENDDPNKLSSDAGKQEVKSQNKVEPISKRKTTELEAPNISLWIPDDLIKNCTICNQEFTFLIRKHHCRSCGQIFCDDCSSGRLPINEQGEPTRVCDDCYVMLTEKYFLPQVIQIYSDSLHRLKIATRVNPAIEIIQSREPVEGILIKPDTHGKTGVYIHSDMKPLSFQMNGCCVDVARNPQPFPNAPLPFFTSSSQTEQEVAKTQQTKDQAWSYYRGSLLRHCRALVIDAKLSEELIFRSCLFEGRVGVSVLGAKRAVFEGCVLRGECAVEIRNDSKVILKNCLIISSAMKLHFEDCLLVPWSRLSAKTKKIEEISQDSLGPCISSGCAIYAEGNAQVTIIDCVILGATGIYATESAIITIEGSRIRAIDAFDIWGKSNLTLNDVAFIGKRHFNTKTTHYTYTEESQTQMSEGLGGLVSPLAEQNPWVEDKDVKECQRCNVRFTSTRRRHHCRICCNIFCSKCSFARAVLQNSPEVTSRICVNCMTLLLLPASVPTLEVNSSKSGKRLSQVIDDTMKQQVLKQPILDTN